VSIATADAPVIAGEPAEAGVPAANARVRVGPDVSAASLTLSAVALGCALQVNFGQYHPLALLWLTVAFVGLTLCVATPASPLVRFLNSRQSVVFGAALTIQFVLLISRSPGATGGLADGSNWQPFRVGVMLAAATVWSGLAATGRRYALALAALLAVYAVLGLWALRAAPDPGVDVCVFQRGAADALLRGDNPYAITFQDPYRDSDRFFGPAVSERGKLQFGYPYPPPGLLLVTPAHLLGDFRYAHLAAMTAAAALIALARPGRVAFAAAALLLFSPRGFFVLEAGWTEPLAVIFLAATTFTACRAPRSVAVPLGVLIATKQYLPLALLAAPLLKLRRNTIWQPVAVAGVVTLPLALWDLSAFVHSVILLQFRQPFRPDALSYLVPLSHLAVGTPPAWIAFITAVLAGALAVRRCPRTPAGFAAAVALVLLAFFAFNKQAFCNYYHLVIGALCCAAGASDSGAESRP
jgi:hypothetical protein